MIALLLSILFIQSITLYFIFMKKYNYENFEYKICSKIENEIISCVDRINNVNVEDCIFETNDIVVEELNDLSNKVEEVKDMFSVLEKMIKSLGERSVKVFEQQSTLVEKYIENREEQTMLTVEETINQIKNKQVKTLG